jgi:uncharacterized protein (DUF433 family)
MATADAYPHLVTDANGRVRIGKTRYTIEHLAAEHHFLGWTAEELLRQHPDLTPAEVYAALAYFHDHHEAVLGAVEATGEWAESQRPTHSVSRSELLRRSSSNPAGG